MTKNKPALKQTSARDSFIESVRRDFNAGKNGANNEAHQSSGTVVAKVNRFNPAANRMKGFTLINKDEEDWLWEVEGDPSLIDSRLGGHAKRPREKCTETDDVRAEHKDHQASKANEYDHNDSGITPALDAGNLVGDQPVTKTVVINNSHTPKRSRTSDPLRLGLGAPPTSEVPANRGGPSRNTRSKAGGSLRGRGGRRDISAFTANRQASGGNARDQTNPLSSRCKGKARVEAEPDTNVAEITAGIDGFSVFSNHMEEEQNKVTTMAKLDGGAVEAADTQGIDAGEWANSMTHSAKVGEWLEKTALAGPPAPANAPKSCAPSIIV
ncbi:hypothetical protein BY996DRAFT_6431386 [Phakopsora pachyrhizi]|uniref:Uncharacterized protein n=1 Tax=Phakopsora pachyrhizi TaxID=170000 RepID=A0AAV0BQM1_PHAPC|nr:hypothetical protein BY996DRAFT_6431386 [Phakopsora pachyrhizi]CAH7688341.1 hypothetical protein PPACK8108_LOCUS23295 [Phakopsora pachyrhizi]